MNSHDEFTFLGCAVAVFGIVVVGARWIEARRRNKMRVGLKERAEMGKRMTFAAEVARVRASRAIEELKYFLSTSCVSASTVPFGLVENTIQREIRNAVFLDAHYGVVDFDLLRYHELPIRDE